MQLNALTPYAALFVYWRAARKFHEMSLSLEQRAKSKKEQTDVINIKICDIRCETVERGDKQIFTSASSGDCEYCCRKLKRMAYDGNVKTAALKK